jgi:hypothetical protein
MNWKIGGGELHIFAQYSEEKKELQNMLLGVHSPKMEADCCANSFNDVLCSRLLIGLGFRSRTVYRNRSCTEPLSLSGRLLSGLTEEKVVLA